MAGTWILYHYKPTLAGAVVFIVLFTAIILFHAVQLSRYQAWFMLPVAVGGTFELLTYICRSMAHSSPQSLGPFIIQSVLSLVAPALLAATIYMTLGRIIRFLRAEHLSLIGVSRLTAIFVSFDVLTFFIQSGGGGTQAGKKQSLIRLGRVLVLVALFTQIIIFGFFIGVAAVFQRRVNARPTQQSTMVNWKRYMSGLYIASGLILLRNLVRVVEYIQGYGGYIQGYGGYINHHEWFLYVFDAVPMFGVMVVMTIIYAPSLFVQGKVEELSEAGVTLHTTVCK